MGGALRDTGCLRRCGAPPRHDHRARCTP